MVVKYPRLVIVGDFNTHIDNAADAETQNLISSLVSLGLSESSLVQYAQPHLQPRYQDKGYYNPATVLDKPLPQRPSNAQPTRKILILI